MKFLKTLPGILLTICFALHGIQTHAQPKFEWIRHFGDSGTDCPGTMTVGSDGYTYATFAFVGQITVGSSVIASTDASNASMALVKMDSAGNGIWVRKLPMTTPQIGTCDHITFTRVKVSPDNSRIAVIGILNYGAYVGSLVEYQSDGTFVFTSDNGIGVYNDIDFDASNNLYTTGYVTNGSVKSAFAKKYSPTGSILWNITEQGQSKGFNIKNTVDSIYVYGHYKGSISIKDVASGSITLNASSGLNGWDIFQAKYSITGILQTAVSAPGIVPEFAGQEPKFSCDVFPSGAWNIASTKADGFGNINVSMRQMTAGFQNALNPTIPSFACSFGMNPYMKNSIYAETGTITYSGYCSPLSYRIDANAQISEKIDIPTGATSNGTPTRDFAFDKNGALYTTSGFMGFLAYRDSAGIKGISSNLGSDDIYVAKYHTCVSYSPIITKSGDTLNCNLTGLYYQWYRDNNPIAGANSQSYEADWTGTYTVRVSDKWDCGNFAVDLYVPVAIQELIRSRRIIVNPNPAKDHIKISAIKVGSKIQLFDMYGRVIYDVLSTLPEEVMDISQLVNGCYLLQVTESYNKPSRYKIEKN